MPSSLTTVGLLDPAAPRLENGLRFSLIPKKEDGVEARGTWEIPSIRPEVVPRADLRRSISLVRMSLVRSIAVVFVFSSRVEVLDFSLVAERERRSDL